MAKNTRKNEREVYFIGPVNEDNVRKALDEIIAFMGKIRMET